MTVAIIDYNMGNIRSVANALRAVGAEAVVSRDPQQLREASHLLLPGVGAFADGMANLKAFGLVPVLNELVLEQKKPLLGICLGMQLLSKVGYEHGETEGLGWVDASCIRLTRQFTHNQKIPHVGWNDVRPVVSTPLLGEPESVRSYYFVHSYHLECVRSDIVVGRCEYGEQFAAVIQQDNIAAAQFHPEKSHRAGLDLLRRFLGRTESAEAAC